MNNKNLRATVASILALASIAAVPVAQAAKFETNLVRCGETTYGSTSGICGGDNLTKGHIALAGGKIAVRVKEALADSYNLYEVYWLPIGAAVTDAVFVGNFATDCNGNAKAFLKEILTAKDALSPTGVKTNMFTTVGDVSSGNFLVYSRGPFAHDTNGDCVPDNFNTTVSPTDTNPNNPLANPGVVLGTDFVQFLSGYKN